MISWTSVSGASLIEYGPAGFTPGTGNQLAATSPFVLNGLNAGQSYEYWIADVCAATSDTSGFSGPVAFVTPTTVPTVNASFVLSSVTLTQATVDFDASNSLNGSSYNWDFGNATGGTYPHLRRPICRMELISFSSQWPTVVEVPIPSLK